MSKIKKYRKKPVVIEAMQVTKEAMHEALLEEWSEGAVQVGRLTTFPNSTEVTGYVNIETLEGTMRGELGDWIIRGVQGEFYPIKPDIFEATYERVGLRGDSDD